MLGYVPFPIVDETPYAITLAPYSFFWLELQPAAARPSSPHRRPPPGIRRNIAHSLFRLTELPRRQESAPSTPTVFVLLGRSPHQRRPKIYPLDRGRAQRDRIRETRSSNPPRRPQRLRRQPRQRPPRLHRQAALVWWKVTHHPLHPHRLHHFDRRRLHHRPRRNHLHRHLHRPLSTPPRARHRSQRRHHPNLLSQCHYHHPRQRRARRRLRRPHLPHRAPQTHRQRLRHNSGCPIFVDRFIID